MNQPTTTTKSDQVPAGQKLFDRPFLWLILGMLTMVVFYTAWGVIEILRVPPATLP